MVKPRLESVRSWRRVDDLTEAEIAKRLGISVATLENYKNQHLEFLGAIKETPDVAIAEVENALLKRAKGFEYEEEEIIVDNSGKKRIKKTTKQVVPDPASIFFYLSNRKPSHWRQPSRYDTGDASDGTLGELLDKLAESRGK